MANVTPGDDIVADNGMPSFRRSPGSRTFAIYRSPEGGFFATDGLCTHEKVHLAGGLVMGDRVVSSGGGRGVSVALRTRRRRGSLHRGLLDSSNGWGLVKSVNTIRYELRGCVQKTPEWNKLDRMKPGEIRSVGRKGYE